MTKFERDTKIARILSAVGVGGTTYCILRLVSPGLPNQARIVLAVLGYVGYLCSILSYRHLGLMRGINCAVDMARYLRYKQEAEQRILDEISQDMSDRGDDG